MYIEVTVNTATYARGDNQLGLTQRKPFSNQKTKTIYFTNDHLGCLKN